MRWGNWLSSCGTPPVWSPCQCVKRTWDISTSSASSTRVIFSSQTGIPSPVSIRILERPVPMRYVLVPWSWNCLNHQHISYSLPGFQSKHEWNGTKKENVDWQTYISWVTSLYAYHSGAQVLDLWYFWQAFILSLKIFPPHIGIKASTDISRHFFNLSCIHQAGVVLNLKCTFWKKMLPPRWLSLLGLDLVLLDRLLATTMSSNPKLPE